MTGLVVLDLVCPSGRPTAANRLIVNHISDCRSAAMLQPAPDHEDIGPFRTAYHAFRPDPRAYNLPKPDTDLADAPRIAALPKVAPGKGSRCGMSGQTGWTGA